ncbi:[FeFe] hydrogenase H-cluster maturation GTPase HydF [Mycoplasmatota bacterium]|nr:[FeFe] hydrogenase H-cluster maturation GTPase HydF [Mycoplasmatota bacterium]
MKNTPRSNRFHIAIFGKRNSGKSSLINALTNQDIAIVSDVLGTTADPVFKTIEILPLGPCVLIDTAGLDDVGILGELRVSKSLSVLNKADIAIIVVDASTGIDRFDEEIIRKVKDKGLPGIIVAHKTDLANEIRVHSVDFKVVNVSSKTKEGIEKLKKELGKIAATEDKFEIVGDLIDPSDVVVLVTPIDSAAPKGRIILPQQQVLRDILDSDGIGLVTKEFELEKTLESLKNKPKMVITDSQAFGMVSKIVPEDIPLTSFSILFARHKGDLEELVRGAKSIDSLKDDDKVLIAEGCTHHRQADDIGTVKIPRWLTKSTGKSIIFDYYSGHGFPENIKDYQLIVHCGACMLNRKEVLHRINQAKEKEIPIVNYGVLIAYVHGIFERALDLFPNVKTIYEE